jgi:serine/threonine protein kinase
LPVKKEKGAGSLAQREHGFAGENRCGELSMVERYEILGQIAVGDFATVYRGRDRELLREVAIKEIHSQYLKDPRQLERFWREAQLLASLQHPHIITIYDLVRPRGWLVLELMQGNVRDLAAGEPLDVDFVRTILASCLDALRFLHSQGIIHGDIKPSNMLVAKDGRVKLGDFGLARRVVSKDGSLLKGTTKYIAPEVISPQFGEVGPASDLYSLGFAAYELLCGPRFVDLFPGLSTFGRDEQMAWLMWHAATDLRLPPVRRVLQGVPADVAEVVDRLVQKNPAARFRSAEEALQHLAVGGPGMPPPRVVEPRKEPQPLPKRTPIRRWLAVGAVVLSAIVSLWLLWPASAPPPPPEPTLRGVLRMVDPGDRRLEILDEDQRKLVELRLASGDQFFLNGEPVSLRELRPEDRVQVEWDQDEKGRRIRRVFAYRAVSLRGTIAEVQLEKGIIQLQIEGSEGIFELHVPENPQISLNEQQVLDGQPITWQMLQKGDRLEVRAMPDGSVWWAQAIRAMRTMEGEGVVKDLDVSGQRLTWIPAGQQEKVISLGWSPECSVSLNGQSALDGKKLTPADLLPGDKIRLVYDTEIRGIEAHRVFEVSGSIARIHWGEQRLVLGGTGFRSEFRVGPETEIDFQGEKSSFEDLRQGDQVRLRFDDLASQVPVALSIQATRSPDPTRWALLVAVGRYEDRAFTALPEATSALTLLRQQLVKRYRVPANQAIIIFDPTRVEFEATVRDFVGRSHSSAEVILLFMGHGNLEQDGTPYLALRDSKYLDLAGSATPLRWLVDQLESLVAVRKILILDIANSGKMVQNLNPRGRRLPMRTVTVITSFSPEEEGETAAFQGSVLPDVLAKAYAGEADRNRDLLLDPSELFAYLRAKVPEEANRRSLKQTPGLFLPDDSPPRLSEEAKEAVRHLARYFQQQKFDLKAVRPEYDKAVQLCRGEPEPHLLYALLALRARQRDEAAPILAQLRISHPNLLSVAHAFVWLELERRNSPGAAQALLELVVNLQKMTGSPTVPEDFLKEIATWCGQVRELLPVLEVPESTLLRVDQVVGQSSTEIQHAYEMGRTKTREILAKFDEDLKVAEESRVPQLRFERRNYRNYVSFPFDRWVDHVLANLDVE